MKTIKLLSTTALLLASSFFATSANATIVFDVAFDFDGLGPFSSNSNMNDPIVGRGTLTFDGPATTGVYSFDTISGLEFELYDETFDLTNIVTDMNKYEVQLNVIRNGDTLYATFIGQDQYNAALSFAEGSMSFVATEAGDENSVNLDGTNLARAYFTTVSGLGFTSGTYQMTAQVPEPGTIALFGFGLIGIVFARKRLSK